MSRKYLDFDVEIYEESGNAFHVVVRSPHDHGHGRMLLPFSAQELDERLAAVNQAINDGRDRRRRGGEASPGSVQAEASRTMQDVTLVREFGRALFDALFAGQTRNVYYHVSKLARERDETLRIRLHIAPSRLAALPWEFLFDTIHQEHVALSESATLVRCIANQPVESLEVQLPLRVLALAANPLGDLDLEREKQNVMRAVKGLQGKVHFEWLAGCTFENLRRAIKENGPWHAFYYLGHGGFDGEGYLELTTEDGRKLQRLYAKSLAPLLQKANLRLALLNACYGARASEQDAFSSTAATLVARGVPAVLAMQFAIGDEAAIEFSYRFFEELAAESAVDAAVTQARQCVSAKVGRVPEWGTPVLYMSAADGVLFRIRETGATSGTSVADSGFSSAAADLTEGEFPEDESPSEVWSDEGDSPVASAGSEPAPAHGAPDWLQDLCDCVGDCLEYDTAETLEFESYYEVDSHGEWIIWLHPSLPGFTLDVDLLAAYLSSEDGITPHVSLLENSYHVHGSFFGVPVDLFVITPATDEFASDQETDEEDTDDEYTDDEYTDDEYTDDEYTDDEYDEPSEPAPGSDAASQPPPEAPLPVGELLRIDVHVDPEAHSRAVKSVAFSPDGRLLLSGSRDGRVRVWNAHTGKWVSRFNETLGEVASVTFSPDGKRLLSGGGKFPNFQRGNQAGEGIVRLWDVGHWQEMRRFEGHKNYVHSVAFSPDGRRVISGSADSSLRVWDAETSRELLCCLHTRAWLFPVAVLSVAISPDGALALTGNEDGTLRLWDLRSGTEVRRMLGHTKGVRCVTFSPDGALALSAGGEDLTMRLWNVATGQELRRFGGHQGEVHSVAFSPDGLRALSGSGHISRHGFLWMKSEAVDCTLRLWDAHAGVVLWQAPHPTPVASVAFAPDGRRAATGCGQLDDFMHVGMQPESFHCAVRTWGLP